MCLLKTILVIRNNYALVRGEISLAAMLLRVATTPELQRYVDIAP